MSPIFYGTAFALSLVVGIAVLLELGRRIGRRHFASEGEMATKGLGPIEGALFGLLGLILAFLLSGALERFDARRHLVVEEANDIGTAWLRIDLLPPAAQPGMRDLFRRYLDARIETYEKLPDIAAAQAANQASQNLQAQIWKLAVAESPHSTTPSAAMLVLPALNSMFDITTTRTESAKRHPPLIVYAMLGTLSLVCSLFAGYDMASRPRLNTLHSVAFALAISATAYVIVDLEFPRLGLIRISNSDQVLIDLRKTIQ
jgi:hypothetical protein